MSKTEQGPDPLLCMLIEDRELLSPAGAALVAAEQQCELVVTPDHSLRIKIIDQCGMACTFCHNEGTPVSADNANKQYGQFVSAGKSSRVSVYLDANNANFVSGTVQPDEELAGSLDNLQTAVGFDEIHLTGGEPTLHPNLPAIVRMLTERDLKVKITSNGERFYTVADELGKAGLSKVVFSIFGTTPAELAAVQGAKYNNPAFAALKLAALDRSINAARQHQIPVSANIVMPGEEHAERISRLIEQYGDVCKIRILNSLSEGAESYAAIYELLARLDARPLQKNMTAGASGMSIDYALPDGKEVGFKQIRRSYLPVCNDCTLKDNGCEEGYYGMRMYVGKDKAYRVGVCIQRMDLTKHVDEFVGSRLPLQIVEHRKTENATLTALRNNS